MAGSGPAMTIERDGHRRGFCDAGSNRIGRARLWPLRSFPCHGRARPGHLRFRRRARGTKPLVDALGGIAGPRVAPEDDEGCEGFGVKALPALSLAMAGKRPLSGATPAKAGVHPDAVSACAEGFVEPRRSAMRAASQDGSRLSPGQRDGGWDAPGHDGERLPYANFLHGARQGDYGRGGGGIGISRRSAGGGRFWMAGSSPAMTTEGGERGRDARRVQISHILP